MENGKKKIQASEKAILTLAEAEQKKFRFPDLKSS